MTFVSNAFSLQMFAETPATIDVEEVETLPAGLESAIGHADTARVLGLPMNRVNVRLYPGDTLYVAQLQGGRLPEGATTLPDGFWFKFLRVTVRSLAEASHDRQLNDAADGEDIPQRGAIEWHF